MSRTSAGAALVMRDVVLRTNGGRRRTDVMVSGARVTAVRPKLPTQDGAAEVVADGAAVVPLMEKSVARRLGVVAAEISAGVAATFALVRRTEPPRAFPGTLMISPDDLLAVLVEGELVVLNGEPVCPAGPATRADAERVVGDWYDDEHDLVQHLDVEGRYSETRGGRVDAYTGRYWLAADRIVYRDDSGFWALGQWIDGRLFHAHLRLDRRG